MSLGLVGRKIGMTRVFTDDGDAVPVTVVDVSNNRVTQIKTPETDGYAAVQVAYGKRRARRVSKPAAGHFAKAAVEAGSVLRVEKLAAEPGAEVKFGEVLLVGSGEAVKVGSPLLAGASVSATVQRHGQGDKVSIVKFRRRKHYLRMKNHRQQFTEIKVTGIQAG